ncbi:MAG: ACT domain-containing protein [Candidatus Margulisiibacteriota bacterium]
MEKKNFITGVALDENVAKIGILNVPDQPGIAARLFGALAQDNINVDMIIQSVHSQTLAANMAFTVNKNEGRRAEEITRKVAAEMQAEGVLFDDKVAKVSIVGVGMISQPGVAANMFAALAEAGINIQMIGTSEIKISCVVALDQGKKAVRVLHKKFEL